MPIPVQLKRNVERFASVFHGYVSKIAAVSLGTDDERYRKTLYFTVLEGLAKARYPKNESSGAAFGDFVVEECKWADGERVSLPHLVAVLERTADAGFGNARQQVFSWYQSWGSGGPLLLNRDPTKDEVAAIWPMSAGHAQKVPELGITWQHVQHRALLYKYRNKLSHESREQTLSFDTMGSDISPHYNSVQVDGDPIEWHLTYPSPFLQSLCRTGIEALKQFCYAELRDPYASFKFGHYLLDSLNDIANHPIVVPVGPAGNNGAPAS